MIFFGNVTSPFALRSESGVLSSLYSWMKLTDSPPQPEPSPEEQEATRLAQACLEECHVEQLVQESKFLTAESLQELLKVRQFTKQIVFYGYTNECSILLLFSHLVYRRSCSPHVVRMRRCCPTEDCGTKTVRCSCSRCSLKLPISRVWHHGLPELHGGHGGR